MPHDTRGAFLLSMQTGVRITDALCAEVRDFDKSGFFHYVAHKTGKAGRAPVTEEFLRDYVKGRKKGEYVFPSKRKKGAHVTRQTVFLHIKAACRRLGIDSTGIAPHTARKAFAVELFKHEGLGKTMHALQHRDAATTLLYALSDDPMPELLKRVERLEAVCKRLREDIEKLFDSVYGDERYTPVARDKSGL